MKQKLEKRFNEISKIGYEKRKEKKNGNEIIAEKPFWEFVGAGQGKNKLKSLGLHLMLRQSDDPTKFLSSSFINWYQLVFTAISRMQLHEYI
jgi:hypothetical protein